MKIQHIAIALTACFVTEMSFALDYVEVIDVKARQRYPWNGLVDVDFELDSRATEPYQMKVTVFDNVGKTNLNVKSVYTEKVSFAENPCMVTKDTSRIVWDAAADLPDGFKCTNVLVTCQDTRAAVDEKRYMVIDLSGGSSASSYPISYQSAPPAGGWTEEYKISKIVLRRVDAGRFMMGSPSSEFGRFSNETLHEVEISKPFYISVYETTQAQLSRISGSVSSSMLPAAVKYANIRGVDVTRTGSKGSYIWPSNSTVDPESYIGRLRSRTGIADIDLPLEAQWEFACRGGSETPLNIGLSYGAGNLSTMARWSGDLSDGRGGTTNKRKTQVGEYSPNALGLYDMIGNEEEWCRDVYQANLGSALAIDPVGGGYSATKFYDNRGTSGSLEDFYSVGRVVKGGYYNSGEARCRSAFRSVKPSNPEFTSAAGNCADSHTWIGYNFSWLGFSMSGMYSDDTSGLVRYVASFRIVCGVVEE